MYDAESQGVSIMVEGLEKVVAMLEERFGRRATTGLLLLIGLAIAVYCLHMIWIHLVDPIYGWVSKHFPSISLPEISIVTVFYVTAAMAAILVLWFAIWFGFSRRRVPQSVVNDLAEFRSEAIHDILNKKVNTEEDLADFNKVNDAWAERVEGTLQKHFPKSELLGFQRLGVIQMTAFPHSFNNEHAHRLSMFAKRLSILEDIIKRYTH